MSEALIRRIKELEEDLEKLKSQLKESSEAGDHLEKLKSQLKESSEAGDHLEKLKSQLKESSEAGDHLEKLKSQLKERSEAGDHLEKLKSQLKERSEAGDHLEKLKSQLKERSEAGDHLEKLKSQLKERSEAGDHLEKLKSQLKERSEAGDHLEKLKSQLKERSEAGDHLEKLKSQLKESSEAGDHLEKLKSQLKERSEAGDNLEKLKSQLKERSEAGDDLEKLKSQLKERSEAGDDLELMSNPSPNENTDCKLTDSNTSSSNKGKKAGKKRPFDFSVHPRRHVALRLAYLGWSYQGFAVQENTDNTVEARLFEALLKTRLILDRQSSNYHRCGRTDKGVSAFSQVITIDLRSTQFCGGLGIAVPEHVDVSAKNKATGSELPYLKMLNRVLPQDIRMLDWAPAAEGFSARFDCKSRTYRYYFPRGSLDVTLMADAAKRYEGTHDFRNLCKMDVGNGVLQFERTILSASVKPVQPQHVSSTDQYDLFVFEIKGLAFLYHQVRCMMALLLLIGQKLEAPEIINQLVDVQSNPRKPQYSMAVDYPLVLYDCHFEGLSWKQESEEVNHVLSVLLQHWTQSAVKTHVLHGMIQGLEAVGGASSNHCWLVEGSRQRNYRPLLERPCCESLESRINHFVKRGRLEREDGENGGEMVHRGKRSKHSHNSPSLPVSSETPSSKQNTDQKAKD